MSKKGLKKWLYWNSANILSSLRLAGPVIFFGSGFDFFQKMIAYIILTLTDLADGPLARRVGNSGGMGKLFDMVPDKVLHISFFIFLLTFEQIGYLIIAVAVIIVIQEVRIALLVVEAANLVIEKELRLHKDKSRLDRVKLALRKVREGVVEKVNVNDFGRWKMVIYSLGGYFYLSYLLIQKAILYYQSIFIFSGGLICSFLAYRKYKFDFEKWKHHFLAEK